MLIKKIKKGYSLESLQKAQFYHDKLIYTKERNR